MRLLVGALTLGLLAATLGCGPTERPVPLRSSTPPASDPAAAGFAVDLAREMYPDLARVANAMDRGDTSAELRREFGSLADHCQNALLRLEAADPGETPDQTRRRHLTLGGCWVLVGRRADADAVDRTLSLFALALAPADAPLAPADRR